MLNEDVSMIGKRILVGLTYLDRHDAVAKQIQLHGIISHAPGHMLQFERSDGGGTFSIPFDGELELADPEAIYTLRSTGEQVSGVDYLASWTIHPTPGTAAEADR